METAATGFTLLELFQMGGIIMWPLLVFSIAAVGITLERTIYLLYHDLNVSDLKKSVEAAIVKGNFEEAREFLESQSPRKKGAQVFLELVKRQGLSEYRLEKAVEAKAMSCVSSLENGFSFLGTLGSISPLTGFLGTVTGMITAFRAIAEAVDVNAQIVASGIYEALITTVFGLVIAIIAMTAHSLLSHKVDKFVSELEFACSDLIAALSKSKEKTTAEYDEN